MEFTPSWGVERVWGEYNYYNTGEPAADKYAFVIDSGISLNTNDLNVNTEWAKSFVSSSDDPFQDDLGHGTAVASVIAAKADNYGLTGVAPGAQVVPLKVFAGGGTNKWIVEDACRYAMEVILANDLVDDAVVNLSLGGWRPDNHPIIEELNDAGITVVIAAGNEALDVDRFSPASYGHLPNVYTISSTTKNNTYSRFTNFDNGEDEDDCDFSAPGSAIPTYKPDGTIKLANGTSFSAPHVAGLFLMGDVKAGPISTMTEYQKQEGMEPDPLALLEIKPEVIIEYVEVPVIEYVEVETIVEVEKIIEVQPPQTTFVGDFNERNRLRGSNRDDVIIGGAQRDTLKGAAGNDYIIGNGGRDKVRGGEGDDTFVCSFDGILHIKDYQAGVDTLALPSDDCYVTFTQAGDTKVFADNTLVAKISGTFDTFV